MSQFFTSGGQRIGVSASASVLPMNIQDYFPLGLTGWISLQSRDSQESSPTPQFKSINSLTLSFLYGPALTSVHDHWKNISQRVSVYFHRISLTEWMQCSKCYVSNVVWETTLCLRLRSRDHFLIRVHGIPVSEVESPGYPGSHCPRQQQGTIW